MPIVDECPLPEYMHREAKPMRIAQVLLLCAIALSLMMSERVVAEEKRHPFVRIAELVIDPAHLERFKASATEQIATAVRVEPGVLALYAVSLKDNPALIKVFEVYADEAAYRVHLDTPHFKRFREETNDIVKSRKLIDTVPIILADKAK
jgi:quinol monooxygenase YgiN